MAKNSSKPNSSCCIDAIDMKLPSMTFATKHDLEAKLFFGCFVEKWLAYESRVCLCVCVCEHGYEGACVHLCVCVCLSVLKTLCI